MKNICLYFNRNGLVGSVCEDAMQAGSKIRIMDMNEVQAMCGISSSIKLDRDKKKVSSVLSGGKVKDWGAEVYESMRKSLASLIEDNQFSMKEKIGYVPVTYDVLAADTDIIAAMEGKGLLGA